MRRLLFGLVATALAATAAAACGDDDGANGSTDTPIVTCSAAGKPPVPAAQTGLPDPVAKLRRQIVDAAVRCDYDALEQLALQGDGGFSYSFGGGKPDDASAYWEEQEAQGETPLRYLADLLDLPFTQTEGNYVWPSAHQDKPGDADWQAVERVYPKEQVAQFRAGGSYLGYRVGITPAGDWIYFVAGD